MWTHDGTIYFLDRVKVKVRVRVKGWGLGLGLGLGVRGKVMVRFRVRVRVKIGVKVRVKVRVRVGLRPTPHLLPYHHLICSRQETRHRCCRLHHLHSFCLIFFFFTKFWNHCLFDIYFFWRVFSTLRKKKVLMYFVVSIVKMQVWNGHEILLHFNKL